MHNSDAHATNASSSTRGAPGQVPPPPPEADAPTEEREAYWLRWVYQGDSMPQLTIRAVLMGGVIGMLMSISNLYTVLKVGWLFGVAITACVMSYVIWNFLRIVSFGRLSKMSILENACMASTASAAGYSTGSTIGTMFGAVLILESDKAGANVTTSSVIPVWTVAIFTLCTAALGVFLAIPMKRQMINREQLPFPSGIAAAQTLKSLYSEGKDAIRQAYALLSALTIGVIIGIINTGRDTYLNVVGKADKRPMIFEWLDTKVFGKLPELVPANGFTQITASGRWVNAVGPDGAVDVAKGKILPGFGFEPSGLLIAAGMLVGLRACLSMIFASALLYFVIAPWLIAQDYAASQAGTEAVRSIELNGSGTVFRLTVWSLWGGTAVMVTSSLTAVALQWRTLARAFNIFKGGASTDARSMESLEVPTRWFVIGMIPITVAMVAIQAVAFHISIHWGIVAVAMSFVLALVAARATGETDTTPMGAMGKVMQLFFGAAQPGQIMPNLAAAGVAANGASACADLLTDLKTGYLLGANPRKQFIAQFLGIFFGTAAIVPAFYLMIPDSRTLQSYPLPSTQQWVAVARLLTEGIDKLPISARWAILIGGLVGVALPVIAALAPKKLRPFMPSAMGIGLAWIMPFANALSFAVGAVIAWIWSKVSAKNCESYCAPVASGLIAGEGLIKAGIAMSSTGLGLLVGSSSS